MTTTQRPRSTSRSTRRSGARSSPAGWRGGDRLPSEAELVRTVRRVADHRRAAPCATCRRPGWSSAGPGRAPSCAAREPARALSFGLLIPDLGETEIFEPICQGMMASPLARGARARLGQPRTATATRRRSAPGSCAGSTSTARVSGVFFAPLELIAGQGRRQSRGSRGRSTTRGIPVVLLDRTVVPYPDRGHHDLVGIDNRRAGYVITEHLLRAGLRGGSRSSPCRTPRPRSTRARPAIAKRCTRGRRRRSTASLVHRLDPLGRQRPSARSWRPQRPTRSSAPTTAPRRG